MANDKAGPAPSDRSLGWGFDPDEGGPGSAVVERPHWHIGSPTYPSGAIYVLKDYSVKRRGLGYSGHQVY